MKQKPIGYLDLTRDVLFKRYCTKNNPVLFSLIKSLLWISDEASGLLLTNPNILPSASSDLLYLQDSVIPPDTLGGKQVVLDIRTKLNNGENVNIKMQNYFEEYFLTRMYFYWAQLHSQQPKRGEHYGHVNPSHLLAFITFNMPDEDDYLIRILPAAYGYQNKRAAKDLEMVIVQLNKFKSLYELVDMADRWCYHQAFGGVDGRASRVFITRRRDENGIRTFRGNVQRGLSALGGYIAS